MNTILVINCGSSSLKYEIYRMPERESLGRGLIERIGTDQGAMTQSSPSGAYEWKGPVGDHKTAMGLVMEALPGVK